MIDVPAPGLTLPGDPVLTFYVGRDDRGSPVMTTDPDRVVDLSTVTTDRGAAYAALHALNA